jgi:hypothetical protein
MKSMMMRVKFVKKQSTFKHDDISKNVFLRHLKVIIIIFIEMSMIGNFASQNFANSIGNKTLNKYYPSLFQKIDKVATEVSDVVLKLTELA